MIVKCSVLAWQATSQTESPLFRSTRDVVYHPKLERWASALSPAFCLKSRKHVHVQQAENLPLDVTLKILKVQDVVSGGTTDVACPQAANDQSPQTGFFHQKCNSQTNKRAELRPPWICLRFRPQSSVVVVFQTKYDRLPPPLALASCGEPDAVVHLDKRRNLVLYLHLEPQQVAHGALYGAISLRRSRLSIIRDLISLFINSNTSIPIKVVGRRFCEVMVIWPTCQGRRFG